MADNQRRQDLISRVISAHKQKEELEEELAETKLRLAEEQAMLQRTLEGVTISPAGPDGVPHPAIAATISTTDAFVPEPTHQRARKRPRLPTPVEEDATNVNVHVKSEEDTNPRLLSASSKRPTKRLRPEVVIIRNHSHQEIIAKCEPIQVTIPSVKTEETTEDVKAPVDRNPQVKVQEEKVICLPPDVLAHHLDPATVFETVEPPSEVEVGRVFLNKAYGGANQGILQRIARERNPSGDWERKNLFPEFKMNPLMPSLPGLPGLYFTCTRLIVGDRPWSVFCKRSAIPARWLYLGEYKNSICGSLTPGQFKNQRDTVKNSWAEFVLTAKKTKEFLRMRARIRLRKAGLLPAELAQQDVAIASEVAKDKNGEGLKLLEQDVISAFERGEEKIDIVLMQCIGYDHKFAKDMEAKWEIRDEIERSAPPPKKSTRKRRKKQVEVSESDGSEASDSVD